MRRAERQQRSPVSRTNNLTLLLRARPVHVRGALLRIFPNNRTIAMRRLLPAAARGLLLMRRAYVRQGMRGINEAINKAIIARLAVEGRRARSPDEEPPAAPS